MTRFAAGVAAAWVCIAPVAFAETAFAETDSAQGANSTAAPREEIIVHGRPVDDAPAPATVTTTAAEIADTINVTNTEDALKYLPDILIRKRHIGDTQAPMATRTSGLGSSARSLIYADGLLLSALIGNNNSTASPRWGMVAPEEIARIEVLYGPYAAAYAGNSIGAVVNISTRMPEAFEAHVNLQTTWQSFSQYGTEGTYPAQEVSALMGDGGGRFAWWLSVNHLDSHGQPLAYVTATAPSTPSGTGAPVTGAFTDVNRTNQPIVVLGAGSIEHHLQDNVTAKAAYQLSDSLTATYTFGYFRNDDTAHAESYLRDGQGAAAYAGNFNINGFNVVVAPSAFSNNVYTLTEDHLAQGLALSTNSGGAWDFSANASLYTYLDDLQRLPSTALPAAAMGGAGALVDMKGTRWYTVDAKAVWRAGAGHVFDLGLHRDGEKLVSNRTATADWLTDDTGPLAVAARGQTATDALWIQDAWKIAAPFRLTFGGRLESWRAWDGFNFSLSPALSVNQPELSATRFSPKASLLWQPDDTWQFTANVGVAFRFPTVSELYQAITTGATLSVPNPTLAPERAVSTELDAERTFTRGRLRLSLFQENIADGLISQSAPLAAGSTTLFNYVQNIPATRARGGEIVGDIDDAVVPGLSFSGSVTYVDARITSDPVFAAAQGKRLPQVPDWRGTLVATYRPDARWSFTAAIRASSRVYATADNSDSITHTFQGFDGYVVADVRARFALNDHWALAAGIDNINDRSYFLFHPFPQRTFSGEIKYTY